MIKHLFRNKRKSAVVASADQARERLQITITHQRDRRQATRERTNQVKYAKQLKELEARIVDLIKNTFNLKQPIEGDQLQITLSHSNGRSLLKVDLELPPHSYVL